MQQYEQNQVWTALEPDITSETAVGFAQQTSPTPSGAPSEEDNLLRATKPKKSCLNVSRPFQWHLWWDS